MNSNQPSLFPPVPSRVRLETPQPVRQEKQRLNAAALRVLECLKPGDWISNIELSHPDVGGLRFGGRLKELRDDGWLIEKRHAHGGTWEYKFIGRKEW